LVESVNANGTGFKEADMRANSWEEHWFSIAGHDRNNKLVSIHEPLPHGFPRPLLLLFSIETMSQKSKFEYQD
jgi:hypothetical protein